ncbi:putative WD repeat-containing protein [Actinoplanes sp. SE50]|uniref:WD40 repeat domain-containing protein n=1 Tax=unclassified Actinoplanes TaxID=2626549 RepID=UPI00023EC4F0|nr:MULTISPECIES: hypothetical protein [unclassified Actinoplanes]AEV87013.1 putative WD repeat-containing protein [Actinoplanes sp. SE50/110]ATO85411.1 putative WD repeat-containing protein [Actinoplanes sp. SE50]SLM02823.1 hypothetical protein ACSP50_6108 [Actinoplanes sp. SE50/110]
MDDAVIAWERPARRLRPALRVDVEGAEVVAVVTGGDGRTLLAVAGGDGPPAVVSLWDTATGERVGEPLTHPAEAVLAMVALPGLLAVAYADADGPLVQVWRPASGERVGAPLPGPFDGSGLAAVSVPDGRHLLAVVEEVAGTLRLWDPATGDPVAGPWPPGIWAVTAAKTSDGRPLLLTLHGDDSQAVVRSWDPLTGDPLGQVLRTRHDEAHPHRLVALPQPDGRLILAVSRGDEDDGLVTRLWDAATGRRIGGPIEGAGPLAVPGPVPLLAAGGGLWDPGSGRRVGDAGTNGVPRPVAAVPGDPTLLAGPGPDGTLWLWDPAETPPLPDAERVGPVDLLAPVTLPGGRTVLTTGVRFWDVLTGEPARAPLTGHAGAVTAVASASLPDGRLVLVTCDQAGTIRSRDPVTGKLLAEVPAARSHVVRSMAPIVMPDGRTLLAVGNDVNVLRLRDPETGASASDMFTRLDRPPLRAVAAVPMPDGRTLLAASNATPARGGSWAARLWDPVTGLPVGDPFAERAPVWSLAATPAGHDRVLLAVGTADGTVQVHDVVSREVLGELPGRHPCLLTDAGGGQVLAVARRDEVELRDPLDWRRLSSHRMGSKVLTLAAAGSRLAIGCAEGLAVLTVA